MSKEEDDLREFGRVLEELAREAKKTSDLKSKLLSDASARLDDISANRTEEDREKHHFQKSRGFSRKAVRNVAMQWEFPQHGQTFSDPLVQAVVGALVETGLLPITSSNDV